MNQIITCQETILDNLYKFNLKHNQEKIQILEESVLALIAGGSLIYALGIKKVIGLISSLIDLLAKVIRFAINQFNEIWDYFQTNFISDSIDNEKIVSAIEQSYIFEAITPNLSEYIRSLDNIANSLVYNNRRLYENSYMALIMDGKDVFDKDVLIDVIGKNRAEMLSVKSFNNKSISEFRKAFRNKIYTPLTLAILTNLSKTDALTIIKDAPKRVDKLHSLKKIITSQYNDDLKMLEYKKRELSKLSEKDIKVTSNFNKQMSFYIQYKKQNMADILVAFSILLDFITTSSKYARKTYQSSI